MTPMEWIQAVLNGEVVASRWVQLACLRHLKDLERQENDPDFCWVFREDLAQTAIDFFPTFLKHTKGEFSQQPFELSDDQKFIIWVVFGWRHPEKETRRFVRSFITAARKWGKTSFVAGVAVLLLYFDYPFEADAEGYVAATKEQQASICHKQAAKFIENNPHLLKHARLFRNRDRYQSIILEGPPFLGSTFVPVGSDSNTSDGWNPHFVIKDELHAWKDHHKGLKDRLETGGGARRQPLDMTVSTNGDENSRFFIAEDNAATSMLEAVERDEFIADRLFAYVARIDEQRPCSCGSGCVNCHEGMIPADDPFDEECWPKANPNIGITPSWEFMREQAARAQREPDWKSNFLRFHCNIQVESKVQLINTVAWAENITRHVDWSKAEQVCGAFDFGWRDDLSAFGAVGRFREGDRIYYVGEVHSFVCENGKRNLNDEPWGGWIADGWLTRTEGNTTDFAVFKRDLLEFASNIGCKNWRFDAYSARQFGTELVNDHGLNAAEFKQTVHSYHEPLIDFIAQVNAGNMLHLGDPLLAWCVGNAVGRKNHDGKMMPDRLKSKDKIDPFVVLVMAFSGARPVSAENPKVSDYYETNTLEIM